MTFTVRRHCELSGLDAAAKARQEVHRLVGEALLAGYAVDREAEDDTTVVVSELVTNAVRHAGGRCVLDLALATDQDDIVIGVTDPAAQGPAPRVPDRSGEGGGFGWGLITCLTHDVTVDRNNHGKTIHAHIASHN